VKKTLIIGIDCAVDPSNTGLCLAEHAGGILRVLDGVSGKDMPPVRQVSAWLEERKEESALVCLDAPLGWPLPLGGALCRHRAGEELLSSAHELFRRYTDDCTAETIGKRPMDVGADRIARTAHAALTLLAGLRRRSGLPLPLGWTPGRVAGAEVLETYPAAWLTVAGLPNRSYKKRDQRTVREEILNGLPDGVRIECGREPFLEDADVLDALLCALVGLAYLKGEAAGPPDGELERAKREGWIWFPRLEGSTPALSRQ
jgi:predicted RNase H-like nuclease